MKEENFIREKCGSGNPFKVPDGYFERFTADVMSKLPDSEHENKVIELHPNRRSLRWAWYSAAAAICGIIMIGTYLSRSPLPAVDTTYYADDATAESIYIDDALDYAMVSNHEIAQYLSEAY